MTRATWPSAGKGLIQTLFSKGGVDHINKNYRAFFFLQLTQCCAWSCWCLTMRWKISSFKSVCCNFTKLDCCLKVNNIEILNQCFLCGFYFTGLFLVSSQLSLSQPIFPLTWESCYTWLEVTTMCQLPLKRESDLTLHFWLLDQRTVEYGLISNTLVFLQENRENFIFLIKNKKTEDPKKGEGGIETKPWCSLLFWKGSCSVSYSRGSLWSSSVCWCLFHPSPGRISAWKHPGFPGHCWRSPALGCWTLRTAFALTCSSCPPSRGVPYSWCAPDCIESMGITHK